MRIYPVIFILTVIIVTLIFPISLFIFSYPVWISYLVLSLCCNAIFIGYYIDFSFTVKKCRTLVDLTGKVVVITGGNKGIGYYTAEEMAKLGAKVIIACRNQELASQAIEKIKLNTLNENISYIHLDLASLSSVRNCANIIIQQEATLDLLVNNAGIGFTNGQTEDGFEICFGVNHLGHFMFTYLLLDLLKSSAPSRVVNVSSLAFKLFSSHDIIREDAIARNIPYDGFLAYSKSKLANVLFTLELADRLAETGVTTYSLHPGSVYTSLNPRLIKPNIFVRMFVIPFLQTPLEGAQTTLYCATSDNLSSLTGMYFSNCSRGHIPWYVNKEAARSLWNLSEELVFSNNK